MPPLPTLPPALLVLVALLVAPAALAGEGPRPMDLSDRRARPVAVHFEISPREAPARRDARWSEALPARLEPGAPGRVRVVVPGRLVEQRLLPDQGVVPGSFEDFVWTFDADSGEVLDAGFRGSLERALGLGFFRIDAGIQLEVSLSTREAVAFREGRRVLGELVHEPCAPDDAADCRRVVPEPYDPATGAVHAVGLVRARSGPFRSRSLCPFGEAIFLEASGPASRPSPPAVAAGPPSPRNASGLAEVGAGTP